MPPNEHETFAPPMPPEWKLAMLVVLSNMPLPAPGIVTVMLPPCTWNPSDPLMVPGHALVTNCVPVNVPE